MRQGNVEGWEGKGKKRNTERNKLELSQKKKKITEEMKNEKDRKREGMGCEQEPGLRK